MIVLGALGWAAWGYHARYGMPPAGPLGYALERPLDAAQVLLVDATNAVFGLADVAADLVAQGQAILGQGPARPDPGEPDIMAAAPEPMPEVRVSLPPGGAPEGVAEDVAEDAGPDPAPSASEPSPSEPSPPSKTVSSPTAASPAPAPAAAPRPEPRPEPAAAPRPRPVAARAPAATPRREPGALPLPAAPFPGMVEPSPFGPLPIVGPGGREAWRAYARPFNPNDPRPWLGLIAGRIGATDAAPRQVIEDLPAGVTLAFAPETPKLSGWIDYARVHGHEVLVELPLEAPTFSRAGSPGPLLVSLDREENVRRLNWHLGRGAGYVGVVALAQRGFGESPAALATLVATLRQRGVMMVDATPVLPNAAGTAVRAAAREARVALATIGTGLDGALSDRLGAAVDAARARGRALAYVTLDRDALRRLPRLLERLPDQGIAMAPASAMARQ